MLYRRVVSMRLTLAAAVLQATTLSFVLIASQIGEELGLITPAATAALTAAALLSVLINPIIALTLLERAEEEPRPLVAGEALAGR